MPHPLDTPHLHSRVQDAIDAHLEHQRATLAQLGAPMGPFVDAIAALLAGGKRLRAAFLYWGYRAVGGMDSPALVRAASAMEVFQAAALLHDDVMDNSDLRRGRPTAHRTFAAEHRSSGWSGEPERFGHAAAILAGDLCLNWTDEILSSSGLSADELTRARPVFDTMRTQLMGGQLLDMLEAARGWDGLSHEERLAQCRTVIRFKSAQYSVQQPLLIGAAAGGADDATLTGLSSYGLALGEAFQVRDDMLGVFGDPETTGKPAGDDLREGKHTVLVAHAYALADEQGIRSLHEALGRPDLTPDEVERCRQVLVRSGAVECTESMISDGAQTAIAALTATPGLACEGRDALEHLVHICTSRST